MILPAKNRVITLSAQLSKSRVDEVIISKAKRFESVSLHAKISW